MAKHWILLCVICLFLTGCSRVPREVTCDQVDAAYEAAGYTVFHEHPSGQDGSTCYIHVEDPKSDEFIYLYWFPTAAEAESYAETREFNGILWLFTCIFGDAEWVNTLCYGNIEIEYVGDTIYDPFQKLIG